MKNIAIFASGNGSNCENIIRHFSGSKEISVGLVITNNAEAKVIERAKKFGVAVEVLSRSEINSSEILLPLLERHGITFIVLAGFMLFIPSFLIEAFPHQIVNIHPSLLPKYGGKGMYGMHVHEAVKAAKETETGITIHFVNNRYDEGKHIAQFKTSVSPTDSAEDIAQKVHALEYEHYPKVIEELLSVN